MTDKFNHTDTSVEEIHELICDEAVKIANNMVASDPAVPKKYKGSVFRNSSAYNDGRLVLEITEEYHTVPDRIREIFRDIGAQSVRMAVMQNQELFVGMIFGEARRGRNYFSRWTQTPERLFD